MNLVAKPSAHDEVGVVLEFINSIPLIHNTGYSKLKKLFKLEKYSRHIILGWVNYTHLSMHRAYLRHTDERLDTGYWSMQSLLFVVVSDSLKRGKQAGKGFAKRNGSDITSDEMKGISWKRND